MFYNIVIALAVIIVLFLIIALQASDFRVVRSARIFAPASAIFEKVNDFHQWIAWSPWDKIDPEMKRVFEGAPVGVGAVYRWVGNKNVGEGGMTITESRSSELIRIRLEFLKPFVATNTTEFIFKPESDGTVVTWDMSGEKNFLAKAIHMFINMDKMIGGQFDKGLANLKSIVEPPPRPIDPKVEPYYHMTYVLAALVYCKDCKCEIEYSSEYPEGAGENYHDAAIAMQATGWVVKPNSFEAFCPTCAENRGLRPPGGTV